MSVGIAYSRPPLEAESRENRGTRVSETLPVDLSAEQLARGLGWFSIGLGLAEVLMPRTLARAIGAPARPALTRAMGMREIAAGMGILSGQQTEYFVWSRVAGDALDLGLLGAAAQSREAEPKRLTAATISVLGVTALDILCGIQLSRQRR